MKNRTILFLISIIAVFSFFIFQNDIDEKVELLKQKSELGSKDNPIKRAEYEFRMLKSPITGTIPNGIRRDEIEFVKTIPSAKEVKLNKGGNKIQTLDFHSRGPVNRGGRVRALGVDVRSTAASSVIIAAGVSGGIWRSTNNGATWIETSLPSQLNSATCIAQDTRAGHQDTWYVGTGESQWGNSASGGYIAAYFGDGIYKSTDNGLSWNLIPSTSTNNPHAFDNLFSFVHSIAVNPSTGTIYAATVNVVMSSKDGGNSWELELSTANNDTYSEVISTPSGQIYASINSSVDNSGIWRTMNDGGSWMNVTPTGFPSTYNRVVIAVAPSDEGRVYILANTPGSGKDGHSFWSSSNGGLTWTDYSSNIPDTEAPVAGYSSQGNYNMVIAVKPDDKDFVVFGGTNLHRSTNGMTTKLENTYANWIGGYSTANNVEQYQNQHPDQHALVFAPYNSSILYAGDDGGVQVSNNISRNTIVWDDINNGFITSQFYSIAMDQSTIDDPVLLGGLQDNGNYFVNSENATAPWVQMEAGGDGAFTAIADGKEYYYIETQNGNVIRLQLNNAGDYLTFAVVQPNHSTNYLFINPYVLDPNISNIMYFIAGDSLWRNSDLSGIPDWGQGPTDVNWSVLSNTRTGNIITAVAASKTPANIVYYGSADGQIYRLNNANVGNPAPTNIWSGKGLPQGYVSSLAIDPNNANNVLAVFSNYEVISLYYTTNGGSSWQAVAGNLEQNPDGSGTGPSCRWASISNFGGGSTYFVATSAGLYSTSSLNGMSTIWAQESPNEIGVSVCTMVRTREGDGNVVVATHGSGVYSGKIGTSSGAPSPVTNVQSLTLTSKSGQSGETSFILSNEGDATLTYNITVTGDLYYGANSINPNVIKKSNSNRNLFDTNRGNFSSRIPKFIKSSSLNKSSQPENILGDDILALDDGDNNADDFIGWGDGSDFYWYNEFNLSGIDFQLDEIYIFMRTESAASNPIYVALYDQNGNTLAEGNVDLSTSTDGTWFSITLDSPIDFSDGETFFIEFGTNGSGIYYPAGVDTDASVINKSFYYNGEEYVNLNTIGGYENGAFLIRAAGTIGSTANQNPIAVANVNPTQGSTNETITFDASNSSDTDGQIVSYAWNFGDGTTSSQKTTTHSYSNTNTYTYTLTVTDNDGATDQVSGQVIISNSSDPKVIVNPSNGSIAPGGSQVITVVLDASTVSEGVYTGQINIATNGGNLVLPIDYAVNVKKEEGLPTEYSLSQNYPNPFNPTTTIKYSIPNSNLVNVKVYNLRGELVTQLLNEVQSAGNYSVSFNATSLASGTYIYQLVSGEFRISKKMLLIK